MGNFEKLVIVFSLLVASALHSDEIKTLNGKTSDEIKNIIRADLLDTFQEYISENSIDLNSQAHGISPEGSSLLNHALYADSEWIAEFLVDKNVDVNRFDGAGNSSLYYALEGAGSVSENTYRKIFEKSSQESRIRAVRALSEKSFQEEDYNKVLHFLETAKPNLAQIPEDTDDWAPLANYLVGNEIDSEIEFKIVKKYLELGANPNNEKDKNYEP